MDADQQTRRDALDRLDAFVGEWDVEARFPAQSLGTARASTTFEWALDRQFLLQRADVDHPDAPNSLAIIRYDPETGGYSQHYFDSRGVVRVYAMEFDGTTWQLLRTTPDVTPLNFSQRFVATFSPDGTTIRGDWETSDDLGENWQHDFELIYTRSS
jgi:hypothetical protein